MFYKRNLRLLKKRYIDIYERIKQVKGNSNEIYQVVKSKSSNPTIKVKLCNEEFFLHSKYNPINEAIRFVEDNYDSNVECFIVYGFGLGYHIRELMKRSKNATIYVFESNICILRQALYSVDLKDILNCPNLKIVLEDDVIKFANQLKQSLSTGNNKLLIHQPSLRCISENLLDIKYLLEDYRIQKNTANHYRLLMASNFHKNVSNLISNVDCLFDKFVGETIFIVSAGPSLSKNVHVLKKVKGRGIIFSVGTAVKPLLENGVYPDLIIITDPQDVVANQIEGIEIDIPIIVLATCNYNIAEKYQGPKMLALQKGFSMSEEYANKNKYQLVETGGSVATTALDIAIKMGCSKIVFVGQDLAYTDGKTHVEGTFFYEEVKNYRNLRRINGINNTIVYTSPNLYIYKKWIEKRIEEEESIKFVNATEGGALVEGTVDMTLEQVVSELDNSSYLDFEHIIKEILSNG